MIPAERAHATITTRTGQTTGAWDKAQATRCPACHAPILTGLDDTVAAFTAAADPNHLTPADELTALLTARHTYRLHTTPRPALRRRDSWQIAGHPAGTVTVLAEHRCGQPLGTTPTNHPQPVTPGQECPF
jgi:hypothetical protein